MVRNNLRKLQAIRLSVFVNWCHQHKIMRPLEMALSNGKHVLNMKNTSLCHVTPSSFAEVHLRFEEK
jgi:hypothetical protein